MKKQKIVIGVTGASGAVYAKKMFENLRLLSDQIEQAAVVFSKYAEEVWKFELGADEFKKIPFRIFMSDDFYAPFASGSAGFNTMIICPCSMGTLGRIASGVSSDLISRTADVMLKEKQKLILVPRETPVSLIHIKNMETITLAGGIIFPASPSFYDKPKSLEEAVDTLVKRVLEMAGFQVNIFRWGSDSEE